MANVKLRIEITADDSLESLGEILTDNMELANTSIKPNADGVFSAFPNNNNATSGLNTLTYGQELCFNDKDELDNIDGLGAGLDSEKNPVEVVWGIVNEDKTYNVTITFKNASDLKNVVVYGDSASKQFPTRAILDGSKEIFSDDYTWSIAFDNPSDTHTIQFTHWNRANYNAVLTLIDVMLQNYEVDIYNGLKSVESLSQSSADTTGIFYGSIESSGSAEILDKNGELGDLLTDGIVDNSNVPITILVNGKEVQHHISTDSSYNRNSKTLSIELGNRLSTLDVLKYKGYDYPDHSENLANLLFDVLSNLRYALFGKDKTLEEKEFKEMLSARYDSTMTLYDYLNLIEVQYPVIEANKTYREVIDEFCLIAQMQMYIDDDNNVKFVSARPKEFNEDFTAIHIPKKNMFSQLDYAVILKNKYDGVVASKTSIIDEINPNTSIFNSSIISLENKSISDYPYITNDELYNKIDGVFNYSQGGSGDFVYYICHKYYYEEFEFNIPKKDNQNLHQVKSVKNYLTSDSSKSYNLTYTKTTSRIDASYSSSLSKITNINRWERLDPEYNPNYSIEEGNGLLDGSINYDRLKLEDEDASNVTVLSEDENYYYVKAKVCVSLEKFWVWVYVGSGQITETSRGEFIKYIPKALSLDIYGEKREITFNQIQSNTPNIELAKTKVSLGSSNLIQDDYLIDTIKTNITEDYKQGISNVSVSISCNDYFDSNARKVIDWSNGELPQVNQIVYFDNDIYKDHTQRYWKIKGRNFRKTGVPMIDLELEECKKWVMSAGLYYKGLFTDWDTLIKKGDITVEVNTITDSLRGYFVTALQGILKIKEGIEIIGTSSFGGYTAIYNNTYLEEISIASSVKRIELAAFYNCPLLSKIKFEENSLLEYIGVRAFSYNKNLNDIIIPKNVKVISQQAFEGCNNLNNVIFEKTEGWFVANSEDATSGISIDVSDPSTTATLLVTTYVDKYFINKN